MIYLRNTYRTESPARSTLSLVLDFGYNILGSPVNRLGGYEIFGGVESCSNYCWFVNKSFVYVLDEFFSGPVSELVDSFGVSGFALVEQSVVLFNFVQVVLEDGETLSSFYRRSVGFSISGLEENYSNIFFQNRLDAQII